MSSLDTRIHEPNYPYQQVCSLIRQRIASGEYRPGQPITSERQLERELGITRLTITKAVAMLANEGLLERRVGRGTFVLDSVATRHLVGLVVDFFSSDLFTSRHPYAVATFRGASEALEAAGAYPHLFACRVGDLEQSNAPLLFEQARRGTLRGLILTFAVSLETVASLLEFGTAIVTVNFYYPSLADQVSAVTQDLFDIARTMAAFCLKEGRRHIAVICGPHLEGNGWRATSADMVDGYRDALSSCDLCGDPSLVQPTPYTTFGVKASLERLLSRSTPPDAILLNDDKHALICVELLREHGFRVPKDVRVISSSNVIASDNGLSSSDLPVEQLGRKAAEASLAQIRGEGAARHMIPSNLVIRDT